MLNAVHFLGPTKGQRGAPADFSSSSSSSVAVGPGLDLRPADLIDEIDAAAEWIQDLVNNGCYRCGFSTRQEAYDEAAKGVVEGLTRVEALLETSGGPFLLGGRMTELDVRLLPTALRFDAAYAPLFRAGGGQLRLRDFRRLDEWLKHCWRVPGVAATIDLEDAWASYYKQLFPLNPGALVPLFPDPEKDLGLAPQP
mmetsp:Transcript_16173/g.37524  ORF Transcript_16173/g.37524 Transcript_16173/m.37524 type:complete len:197 (-) Transcript_16173:271-861(-)